MAEDSSTYVSWDNHIVVNPLNYWIYHYHGAEGSRYILIASYSRPKYQWDITKTLGYVVNIFYDIYVYVIYYIIYLLRQLLYLSYFTKRLFKTNRLYRIIS